MANRAAGLDIEVRTTGAAAAAADLKGLGTAAKGLGDDAEKASRGIAISADSADELAGKTGKATGALGALAGGLEAVGLEKFAAGLQGAAIATDFASGAGDALNLVMESTAVKATVARAKLVAQGVASTALAVKTGILTAATGALNAVMALNPITLVVIAAVALVAVFGLLFAKSEGFRTVVGKVGDVGKKAFQLVTDAAKAVFNKVEDLIRIVKDRIPSAFEKIKDAGGKVKDFLLAPFEKIKGIIDDIIGLISKIKLPDIKGGGVPFVPGIRVAAGPVGTPDALVAENNVFNFYGVLDFDEAAARFQDAVDRRSRRLGL